RNFEGKFSTSKNKPQGFMQRSRTESGSWLTEAGFAGKIGKLRMSIPMICFFSERESTFFWPHSSVMSHTGYASPDVALRCLHGSHSVFLTSLNRFLPSKRFSICGLHVWKTRLHLTTAHEKHGDASCRLPGEETDRLICGS